MGIEEVKRRVLLWAPDNPRFRERITALDEVGPVMALAVETYGNDITHAFYGDGMSDDDIKAFRPAGPDADVLEPGEEGEVKPDPGIGNTEVEPDEGPVLPPVGGGYEPEGGGESEEEGRESKYGSSLMQLIDQVVDAIPSVTDKDMAAAYEAETVFEAVQTILSTLTEMHVPLEDQQIVKEVFPEEMGKAAVDQLFGGESEEDRKLASQDFLAIFYDGEFAENHDWMVDSGYRIKLIMGEDGDLTLYYIEPETHEVIDIANDRVGSYDLATKDITFLSNLPDTREPIGMPMGSYGTQGEFVGEVAANPLMSPQEFFDSFGWDDDQNVTNKTWLDVIRDDLSLPKGVLELVMDGRTNLGAFQQMYETSMTETTVQRTFEYLKGDEVNMLIDMPLEDIAGYQQKFAALGPHVYTVGTLGLIDPKLVNAFNVTMAEANHNNAGINAFDTAIDHFDASADYTYNWFGGRPSTRGSSGGGATSSRVWRPPAYLSPDYAELEQAVKATFEAKLGRKPSDAEISVLSTKMKADHRGEFDAQALAQRLQFFSSGGLSAGTVQDVNYAARFQEDFADKYTNELGTLDKIDMSRNITQSALGSILAADRAIGY